ncbi:hypothetical protein GOP47_0016421 [Adiantum capillus-veneris]|uniref:Secreted protein n=1 Tax=Adiantum capillus-veneris TaxID=13818 RepID=A0A9D4UHM4_ADICA|nr:hypothetical protein GOP47_0016421 [Adiantum capillus-veneris]
MLSAQHCWTKVRSSKYAHWLTCIFLVLSAQYHACNRFSVHLRCGSSWDKQVNTDVKAKTTSFDGSPKGVPSRSRSFDDLEADLLRGQKIQLNHQGDTREPSCSGYKLEEI